VVAVGGVVVADAGVSLLFGPAGVLHPVASAVGEIRGVGLGVGELVTVAVLGAVRRTGGAQVLRALGHC
jgi:hypothetical protein